MEKGATPLILKWSFSDLRIPWLNLSYVNIIVHGRIFNVSHRLFLIFLIFLIGRYFLHFSHSKNPRLFFLALPSFVFLTPP